MKLLIVESPAKAKTITKYLDNKYKVLASVGHIRDLPKSNKKAIDIEGGFVPHYEVAKGKEAVVKDLKSAIKKADEVVLATDPDREGEAIAWHIEELSGKKDLKRIAFNEITKEAVQEALKHPRSIDTNLRRAQEARRVLDRLVGYDLSGLIWKKLRYGLSAGRVQSPALRILMEREKEIRAFKPEAFWVITADTQTKKKEPLPLACSIEPKTEEETDSIIEAGKKGPWVVDAIEEREVSQSPRAPFITSTLQQAANSRLGFSPSKTMGVAQKLYEAGHITYMRTDSPTLSGAALKDVTSVIKKGYGDDKVEVRAFKTRKKSAQEAHEAIRPTSASKKVCGTTAEQKKLYSLIWSRTIASQMVAARVMRTKVIVQVGNGTTPPFHVNGSRIKSPGWLLADPYAQREDVILPEVSKGGKLTLVSIEKESKETQPPNRYSEAGLIKELEKREIGRPSTYASIIKVLVDREYVEKQGRTLIPTDTGEVVNDFLENHFTEYISDDFTSEMEKELDEIAEGKREYASTLSDFYTPFQKRVESKEHLEKISNLGEADKKHVCPVCGDSMVIKLGKTGKFLSCKKFPDCTGARKIDGTELAQPKEIGEDCPDCKDGKLVQKEGRFGMFIACSNYPKCKHVKQDPSSLKGTGVTCPECKKGEMVERRGRFGIFYSCSGYPKCKYAIKAKPTGNTCPMCGKLMMEGTKTIPERCSDKACPNHNPHKLDKK
ncbi:DNA topoisomerase I [bacterium]|nr:DNA topoisomerase I [bacterium]